MQPSGQPPTDMIGVLEQLGYQFRKNGNYYQSCAVYRDGTDPTSLCVYPKDNVFVDFVTNERGPLERLVGLTLKISNDTKLKEWFASKNYNLDDLKPKAEEPKVKMPKTYSKEILQELLPIYDFYLNKGISLDTLKAFQCGLATKGQLKDRIVFPIFNSGSEIIGFAGRDVTNSKQNKWKILSPKIDFVYSGLLASKEIQTTKKVILVESIGDCLALYDAGIKNVLVLFGINCSFAIINYLLKVRPTKIYISTNNDAHLVGNEAAIKIQSKLWRYFDKHQIEIKLPPAANKDFGNMSKEEIVKFWS